MAADRVLEGTVTKTLIFRKIAVPVQGFDRRIATQRASQFLADNPATRMARLTIVPDMKPATYYPAGCDHCDPYTFWRGEWDPVSTVNFPIGELMSVEGNAVLRYRDEKGAVSVTVLRGSDPRPIRVGDYHGLIIQVGMHGRIAGPLSHLYVVGTGTIAAKDGAAYAREFAARLGVHASWIEFRADPWFIDEIWTPFFPFFDASGQVPSKAVFKTTKTPYCFYISPTTAVRLEVE